MISNSLLVSVFVKVNNNSYKFGNAVKMVVRRKPIFGVNDLEDYTQVHRSDVQVVVRS